MTTEPKLEFTQAVQENILAMTLIAPDTNGVFDAIRPEHYDHPACRAIAVLLYKFKQAYHRQPTLEELAEEFEMALKADNRLPDEEFRRIFDHVLTAMGEGQFDYVADKALAFARTQAQRNVVSDAAEMLKKGKDISAIKEKIDASMAVGKAKRKSHLTTISSDQRVLKQPTWLWPEKFQKGKVTLLAGDPSSGKSLFLTWMAAQISAGRLWPDNTPCEAGSVLVIQGEEDWEEVVKARLIQYGADESKVAEVTGVNDSSGEDREFSLDIDLEAMRDEIAARGDVRMVAVDPLSGYYGRGRNTNAESEMRRILMALSKLAKETGVAVVGVTHLNKSSLKDDIDPIYRIPGSIAIMAVCRTAWLMAWDGKPDGLRYLQRMKNSRRAGLLGMAFNIRAMDGDGAKGGDIMWHDEVEVPSARDLLRLYAQDSKERPAHAWCRTYLASGPKESAALWADGFAALGLSEQALRRALLAVGARSVAPRGTETAYKWTL